jgi:hypothetical protein
MLQVAPLQRGRIKIGNPIKHEQKTPARLSPVAPARQLKAAFSAR